MNHAAISFDLQAALNPPHLADAAIQQPCRLDLAPLAFQYQTHHLQNIPLTPTHLNQVLLHPLFMSKSGHFYLRNTGHFYLRRTA